jgi:hypothetical protein
MQTLPGWQILLPLSSHAPQGSDHLFLGKLCFFSPPFSNLCLPHQVENLIFLSKKIRFDLA